MSRFSSSTAACTHIQYPFSWVCICVYEILTKRNRFLSIMNLRKLFITGELKHTSGVSFCTIIPNTLLIFVIYITLLAVLSMCDGTYFTLMPRCLLRIISRKLSIKNKNVFMRFQGHFFGVQMSGSVSLLPNPFVPEIR